MEFKQLSKPGKIGIMRLKNRIIQPEMETWSAGSDGMVTESTINHYARRAAGGVGLIITEMTNPTPGCMCFPGELEISQDKYMPGMSKIADAIHAGGAKAAIQLCHGGVFARNSTSNLPAFTPSGIGTFSLPEAELKVMTELETAQQENFDKIIAATGSEWFIPNIEGANDQGILNPLDVLDDHYPDVEHFLVCGAGISCRGDW